MSKVSLVLVAIVMSSCKLWFFSKGSDSGPKDSTPTESRQPIIGALADSMTVSLVESGVTKAATAEIVGAGRVAAAASGTALEASQEFMGAAIGALNLPAEELGAGKLALAEDRITRILSLTSLIMNSSIRTTGTYIATNGNTGATDANGQADTVASNEKLDGALKAMAGDALKKLNTIVPGDNLKDAVKAVMAAAARSANDMHNKTTLNVDESQAAFKSVMAGIFGEAKSIQGLAIEDVASSVISSLASVVAEKKFDSKDSGALVIGMSEAIVTNVSTDSDTAGKTSSIALTVLDFGLKSLSAAGVDSAGLAIQIGSFVEKVSTAVLSGVKDNSELVSQIAQATQKSVAIVASTTGQDLGDLSKAASVATKKAVFAANAGATEIQRAELTAQIDTGEKKGLEDSQLVSASAVTNITTTNRAETAAVISSFAGDLPKITLKSRAPFIVAPGTVVEISGTNFRTMTLALNGTPVANLNILSDTRASFTTPSYSGFGLASLAATQDGVTESVSLFYQGASTDHPLITLPPTDVCSGVQYYDASGSLKTGSKSCGGPAACTAGGQRGCVTSDLYLSAAPPPDLSNLSPTSIKSGVTIAGTLGTYAPACATDGAGSCYVDGTTYKAAKLANYSASDVKSGVTIGGVSGSFGQASCSSNGEQNCVASGTYKAAIACSADGSNCYLPSYATSAQPLRAISYDIINANASKIRASVNLGGVSGTLADCSTDGATGCVTTTGYKSVNVANLAAGNIKRGVSLAGVTGVFPSDAAPLPRYTSSSGANLSEAGSEEPDLTAFITQLTSAGTFEYWDSSGIRWTGSGDADITAANVKNSVVFENLSVTGTYGGGGTALDVWDVRAGVNIGGGILGKLKVNCRNSINSSYFNIDTLSNDGLNDGTNYDIWDTIDDISGQPPFGGFPPTWSVANNYCGGVESVAGDDSIWKDVSTFPCAADPSNCRYQDKISRQEWAKPSPGSYTWSAAISYCDSLTYDSLTDWRVPTQKEMHAANTHGIKSAAGPYWIDSTAMGGRYWSSTSAAVAPSTAWYVDIATGYMSADPKTYVYKVICVR